MTPRERTSRPHRRARLACTTAVLLVTLAACARHETAGEADRRAPAPPHAAGAVPPPQSRGAHDTETFEATAYSIEGRTASGERAREGICAADPDILPLGTRIRVHDAGAYSGECEVADTGSGIKGREIDIYLASDREAKEFGRKQVRVEVLSAAK